MRKAVVLLSGGIDSLVTLATAMKEGYDCHALSFSYGQRHNLELVYAAQQACKYAIPQSYVEFDLRQFGNSSLTDETIPVSTEDSDSIPTSYVPARNTIFLSFGMALCETIGSSALFIGANLDDCKGYPDCRPIYFEAYLKMASLATKAGVEGTQKLIIYTPLIRLTKAEIVAKGVELGVNFSLTWSCYDPQRGSACGVCDACRLRTAALQANGIEDPVVYVQS